MDPKFVKSSYAIGALLGLIAWAYNALAGAWTPVGIVLTTASFLGFLIVFVGRRISGE